MEIKIMETKTVPTVEVKINAKRIVFHSKYNPIKEATDWTKNALRLADTSSELIVIGLAAGYHLQTLSAAAKDANIIVLEFNSDYFKWIQNSPFYKDVQKLSNVTIYDIKNITDNIREDILKNLHSNNILIQKNALEIFPKEYEEIKEILKNVHIQKNSFMNQLETMEQNFNRNVAIGDRGIKKWRNYYDNQPMLLISAGPSLDKQLPLLKKIYNEQKILIGSVGTAVKPLLRKEIFPDFLMITDPNEGTFRQLEDVNLPNTPLFYLSTAFHETIMLHKGPRYIVFQEGYNLAEIIASSNNTPLIKTGGSVATTLLDLMVYMGATVIGLVGQDLAFTGGISHANFTPQQKVVSESIGSKRVLDYYQDQEVVTSNNLNIYRRWFVKYALNHQNIQLFNCTEGGAYINGWLHSSLLEFYNQFGRGDF